MSTQQGLKSDARAVKWRADLFENVNKKWDEGLTYRQIAEHFGITVAQVEAKIRGRQRNSSR